MTDGYNERKESKPCIQRSSLGLKLRIYVALLLSVKGIPNQLLKKDKRYNGGSGRGCFGSIITILLEIPRVEREFTKKMTKDKRKGVSALETISNRINGVDVRISFAAHQK